MPERQFMEGHVPDCPIPGYTLYRPADPFEEHVGPMYYRRDGQGVHCLLPTHEAHRNAGNIVHGGVLLSFADYALATAGGALDGKFALTVSLNASFLAAGRIGPTLEAEASLVRTGKTLAFARATISQEGALLMAASAVFRPIDRLRALAGGPAATPPPTEFAPAPAGYTPIERPSKFMNHIGPIFYGQRRGKRHIVQPTAAHMVNTGGLLHGGMLMSFADNAFSTEVAEASGGRIPITTGFNAEFLSAGKCGPLLETSVEMLRMTRNVAFVRGTVEQQGAALLNYNAVVMIKDRAAAKA